MPLSTDLGHFDAFADHRHSHSQPEAGPGYVSLAQTCTSPKGVYPLYPPRPPPPTTLAVPAPCIAELGTARLAHMAEKTCLAGTARPWWHSPLWRASRALGSKVTPAARSPLQRACGEDGLQLANPREAVGPEGPPLHISLFLWPPSPVGASYRGNALSLPPPGGGGRGISEALAGCQGG